MKTRATLFFLIAVGFAGALWFSASLSAVEKTAEGRNIVIDDEGIVIPGTELSTADHAAMNRILNKYDKSLYRIDTYVNGKLKKTQGTLTDVVTDKQLASQMAANLQKPGFTHYAVQIRTGSTTHPTGTTPSPGATTNPTHHSPVPGASTNPANTSNTSPVPGASTNPANASNTSPVPGASTNPASSTNRSPVPGATTNPARTAPAPVPGATTNPAITYAPVPSATTNPTRTNTAPVPSASTNPTRTTTAPGATATPTPTATPGPGSTTNPASSANAAKSKSTEGADRLKAILEKYRSK
jgi:hypothetical protein